jgi:hypothetical protein
MDGETPVTAGRVYMLVRRGVGAGRVSADFSYRLPNGVNQAGWLDTTALWSDLDDRPTDIS